MSTTRWIRWFSEIGADDVPLVGGKIASLGEMYRKLADTGVRVPDGFAVTADAYRYTLDSANAWDELRELLAPVERSDVSDLAERAEKARTLVASIPLPTDLEAEILQAHRRLTAQYDGQVHVAVRSSATAEDLPSASFAGQHESYLNVPGGTELLDSCRRCFASVFTERAVRYRIDQGFDHLSLGLSVGIMKMVRSDLAASGVMFTLDPDTGFRDAIFVTSAYGLGENVVQGTVDPDEFLVHKPTYELGHRVVLERRTGGKEVTMVCAADGGRVTTRNVSTAPELRERLSLSDDEVLELAGAALQIEAHYGVPMDIEWAKDGVDGRLYIVQARPETVASRRAVGLLEIHEVVSHGEPLTSGRAVGEHVATGAARLVRTHDDLVAFRPGEVLVADTTTPDWTAVLSTASAVVTDRGGRTCHAAIVARELGIPAVVGTGDGTTRITDGETITVSCAEGDVGQVYRGAASVEVHTADLSTLPRPATRLMVNLGNPDLAFKTSLLPCDGVGLARMEFIITDSIRAHPLALLHPERVVDPDERRALDDLVRGYEDGAAYFVQRLSEGVGMIAAAFYPRPVVVRMSDFKTNEYAELLGGAGFEQPEDNPMLGFRGASRYAHLAYAEGFALECAAVRRVRDDMGLTNVVVMLPFVRRLEEADRVLARMAELGLARGSNGLEVYAMCEIPNNVILVDEFSRRFDGFSIGSNDLTQLTLGVDRDNEVVAFDYDERDAGVKQMIRLAIEGCRRNGIHSGFCGQAPSDYPEMAEFLVELGIDSISLTPDSLLPTLQTVLDAETRLGRRQA
jgi:pyruvate,water dikinase